MNPSPVTNPYKRHRFPADIISHCVWLYFRCCLSDRDVEELRAERGVTLTYEAVRYGCRKFGQVYANQWRRRCPRPGDKWHPDDAFLSIHGERHYLRRAVDQDGRVPDTPVPPPDRVIASGWINLTMPHEALTHVTRLRLAIIVVEPGLTCPELCLRSPDPRGVHQPGERRAR